MTALSVHKSRSRPSGATYRDHSGAELHPYVPVIRASTAALWLKYTYTYQLSAQAHPGLNCTHTYRLSEQAPPHPG